MPSPQLSNARVDPTRSYVYDHDEGAFNQIGDLFTSNEEDQRELYAVPQQRINATAQQGSGIVARARENTNAMLQSMLRALGFTSVTVNFVEPSA